MLSSFPPPAWRCHFVDIPLAGVPLPSSSGSFDDPIEICNRAPLPELQPRRLLSTGIDKRLWTEPFG